MTDSLEKSIEPDAEAYLQQVATNARNRAVADAHYAAVVEGRSLSSIHRADIEEGRALRDVRAHQQVRTVVSVQIAALLVIAALCATAVLIVVLLTNNSASPPGLYVIPTVAIGLAAAGTVSRTIFSNGKSKASARATRASSRLVRPVEIDYLVAWDSLERRMRDEVETSSPGHHVRLARVVSEFCSMHDIDPAEVHDLLRIRNDIAHRGAKLPPEELATALAAATRYAELPDSDSGSGLSSEPAKSLDSSSVSDPTDRT